MTDEWDPRTTPWQIDEAEFYEIEDSRTQLEFLLRYATLAPSSHNTQPWSFRLVDDGVVVFADYGRRLPVGDPADRELLMSVGAAIANFRVAAAHFGYETTVMYEAGEDPAAPVAFIATRETCNPPHELSRLFQSISRRRTNRHPYEDRALDPAALDSLCDFMEEHSEYVQFLVQHDHARAADLVAEGDRILMSNEAYRRELADWMRPNESSATDGICGDAFGIPGPVAALGGWMLRTFDLGATQASHDRALVSKAPGLIVITADDDRVSLIRAGETLELLLLLLTSVGVQYSFMNQPVELEPLRRELWSMIRSERPPQLMIRIGYARPVDRPMPRRDVRDVVR
jgi:hypothetical protein